MWLEIQNLICYDFKLNVYYVHIKQQFLCLKGDVLFSSMEKMKTLQLLVFFKHVFLVMTGVLFAAVSHPFIIWNVV